MCIIAHTNFTSRTKIFNSYRGRALAGYLSVTEWQQVERCDFVWSRFFFESHGICCLSRLPLSAFDCSFSFAVCVSWPLTSSVRVPTWQYKCLLEQHKVMWCEVCMCVCACVTVQTSDRFQDLQRAPVVSLISLWTIIFCCCLCTFTAKLCSSQKMFTKLTNLCLVDVKWRVSPIYLSIMVSLYVLFGFALVSLWMIGAVSKSICSQVT